VKLMERGMAWGSALGLAALVGVGLLVVGLLVVGLLGLEGCGPRLGGVGGSASVGELRASTERGADEQTLARWLLAELISPGGTAEGARRARQKLDASGSKHYLAHLARGLDDRMHGRLAASPEHFMAALEGAREESSPAARLVAWFAATQSSGGTRGNEAWAALAPRVQALIEKPGGIGWRARAQLVEWWLDRAARAATPAADDSVQRLGCVTAVRFAGPFGTPAPVHLHRHFAAEAPGPWPQRWPVDPDNGIAATVLPSVARGCEVRADVAVSAGVFYTESYLELGEAADVILAAQGALALWVDDRLVLDRDPRTWGVWPKFGVRLRLSAGRHRVLARVSEARTLLRALRSDGTPLLASASTEAAAPYALEAPELLADPNDLMRFIGPEGVFGEPDDITRFIAAELAHLEGEDDVVSVLMGPLTEPLAKATGPSLASLADWVVDDPALGRSEATDKSRALQEAAAAKDPELWRAQLGLALAKANSGSLSDAVAPLEALTRRFPEVPAVWNALGVVLGRLGWQPEQRRVVLEMAERFDDPVALEAAASVYDLRGDNARADAAVAGLQALDASSDIALGRALRRRDYPAALSELERLKQRSPFRRAELERKQREVRLAAGDTSVQDDLLAGAVEATPESGAVRLALADARWAKGDADALTRGLAEATLAGSDPAPLEQALDAVEARSDFAPYRLDGKQVIAAYEKADRHQSATAARVLDYAAVWVHADGSSRMLEHEIVRIQSAEAISKFAEHRKLEGLVLNMRVLKRNGRTLEPEPVAGKPTVTFPHLEVGDYIETEHVQGFPALEHGRFYPGLRWFFREEDVAYARSEFVLIAPSDRALDIELTGAVPEPELTSEGSLTTRRWRVEESPAAPVEPLGAPVQEYLPSVRVGWGDDVQRRLRLLSEQVADTAPIDPRIAALAQSVAGPAEAAPLERARKAYRWVQDNIKDGQETDARKVLTSQNGNRWSALRMLLRALDIPVSYLVVKNRLAAPAPGPMWEAEAFNVPLLYVGQGDDAAWLTVQEQFAPFGYVPVEARGMPAFELSIDGRRSLTVPAVGDQDRLEYEGQVRIGPDGSARLSLRQRFVGKYAIRLRAGLTQVPEGRLHDVLESRLLGGALPGAELFEHSIEGQGDLDAPLVVEMQAGLAKFAEVDRDRIVIEPPLMPRLTRLASLPERQTPLLIREAMHQSARLEIAIEPGTQVWGARQGVVEQGEYRVVARDVVKDRVLVLDREVSIAAGRVSPADYARFLAFTRDAEQLLAQPIVLTRGAPAAREGGSP
jgi:cellulose synthase operon protein C